MKYLIIVDMQNDFIDGSLANKDAQVIVPKICEFIKGFDGQIICTLDTHKLNYLSTPEGKNLPIEHCIKGTAGWNLSKPIMTELKNYRKRMKTHVPLDSPLMFDEPMEPVFIEKSSFGYTGWEDFHFGYAWEDKDDLEIILVGTCTDICVISNALMLKSLYPEIKITVLKDLCAGVTKEKHEAALEVMKSCQINVE